MTEARRPGGLPPEMAAPAHDPDRDVTATEPGTAGPSDLIGLRLTLYLGVAILVVLAAFFFIGPVAGIIVLLAAVALGIAGVVAAIRRADVSD